MKENHEFFVSLESEVDSNAEASQSMEVIALLGCLSLNLTQPECSHPVG